MALGRIDAEHRAADAGVLVVAGGAVGTSPGAEFELSELEVLLELLPLGIRGIPVSTAGRRARRSATNAVGADQVVLEDRETGLSGVEARVTEQPGRDVDRQTAGDGFGDQHPPEVVWGVAERLADGIRGAGEAKDVVKIPLNEALADHLSALAENVQRFEAGSLSSGKLRRGPWLQHNCCHPDALLQPLELDTFRAFGNR
ncbi:hypothetical protein AB0G03_04445 [Micromonospora aurantiaca]|uniref:hypothetical protein n=1 Tax=Micromonospora aurantiaca (nom. illeg.) TaxID=47850 RepID=UPI00340197B3